MKLYKLFHQTYNFYKEGIMKIFQCTTLTFAVILILTAGGLQRTQAQLSPTLTSFDITGSNSFTTADLTLGWEFLVNSNITVTSLGFLDVDSDGLLASHEIGLWDSGGNLLGYVTVTPASTPNVDNFLYENLATPIDLTSGNSYRIAAYVYGDAFVYSGNNIVTDPSITFGDSYRGFPGFTFPSWNDGRQYLTSNFAVQTGSYDIYKVNTKSGNVERVSFIDDADEFNPSFSNDGKKVAHDVVGGSAPLGHSIYITDVNTGVSTLLDGADGGNDASWSPNGQYIAFDRGSVGDLSIYIVPANGGTRTLLRTNAVDAEYSNNSHRLVFQDITDGSVRTVDVNGGSETIVAPFGVNPSWSPNGKYIAYTDGNNIIKISVNQHGEPQGSPVQLTNDGTDVFNQQPSWSNNSKTIVFHSNRETGDFDLWTISASGGTPLLLTGLPENGDFDPCYSKNGKYVSYAGFTSAVPSSPLGNGTTVSTNESSIPNQYILDQNFPNPFNPTTQIRFGIPEASNVTLRIYNSVGQLVKTLVDGNMSEGYHQVTWDATDNSGNKLSSGVYFYRITTGTFNQVNKMLLMK